VRRTIWDGVQELGEIQAPVTVIPSPSEEEADSGWSPISTHINHKPDPNPFYGRVVYTPGLAVDQPLSVTRIAYRDWPRVDYDSARTWDTFTLIPQWNAYGVPGFGSLGNGDAFKQFHSGGSSCPPVGDTVSTRCALVQWPAAHSAYDQRRGNVAQLSWQGSLLEAKRDGSGYEYKRNRYYDPTTGRFTQEDPIGLAGGLNLYGFASADPVALRDPFGLCDDPTKPECRGIVQRVLDAAEDWANSLQGRAATALARGVSAIGKFFGLAPGASSGAAAITGIGGSGEKLTDAQRIGAVAVAASELFLARPGAGRLTNAQATDLAGWLGYGTRVKDAPFNSMGQLIFTNGKTFIAADVTSHVGGVWKMFDRSGMRIGTFDALLNLIGR
jgi:RHS repeat-associated protein